MRPYSLDLRERIPAAIDDQESSSCETARLFRVSTSFILRLLRHRRGAGTLDPAPHGGGRPPALGADDFEHRAALVREQPDATLEQLKRRGCFTCSLKTHWYAFDRLGLTFKEKSLHASRRDRPDVQKKRRSSRREVRTIEPSRPVFGDETWAITAMTPDDARAPRGERAVASWDSVTVIAVSGLDGVRAPLAFAGATDVAASQTYAERVLVPRLYEGDVVIFDDLKLHSDAAPPVVEAAPDGALGREVARQVAPLAASAADGVDDVAYVRLPGPSSPRCVRGMGLDQGPLRVGEVAGTVVRFHTYSTSFGPSDVHITGESLNRPRTRMPLSLPQ